MFVEALSCESSQPVEDGGSHIRLVSGHRDHVYDWMSMVSYYGSKAKQGLSASLILTIMILNSKDILICTLVYPYVNSDYMRLSFKASYFFKCKLNAKTSLNLEMVSFALNANKELILKPRAQEGFYLWRLQYVYNIPKSSTTISGH